MDQERTNPNRINCFGRRNQRISLMGSSIEYSIPEIKTKWMSLSKTVKYSSSVLIL